VGPKSLWTRRGSLPVASGEPVVFVRKQRQTPEHNQCFVENFFFQVTALQRRSKILENKLRYFLLVRVLFYIKKSHSRAMRTISLTTKHCLSLAAIWLQAASVLSPRFMVKYGPNTGTEHRTQEVRG